MKTKKFVIGDLMTERGKVINLGDDFECVLSASVWYNTKTTGSLFKKMNLLPVMSIGLPFRKM